MVFPEPGGPQRRRDGRVPELREFISGVPAPMTSSWPTISEIVEGRILSARGAKEGWDAFFSFCVRVMAATIPHCIYSAKEP